ncbi:MAG TPA: YncE family protein [Methylomirabilota bacterium]|nr:YncE family protein [Methylomirabilota bacterium]
MTRALTALATLAALLGLAGAASAGHLILSANDGKYPNIEGVYKVADPMPADTLTILDARSFPPRAIAEIETNTSVIGPPLGVALTPDERLALVSCPVKADPNDKTKLVSHDELQVVDLEASPPRVIARLAMPSRPCGLSVNRAGTLAVVAHPDDGGVSLLTISGKTVALVSTVKVGDAKSLVSHAAVSPDGKWVLATKRGEGKVAVLTLDGAKLEYAKQDITVGFGPYPLDISRDGRLAAVGNQGLGVDVDTVTLIDMTVRPIRAVEYITVGVGAEGLAFSPDGKWLAVALQNGTNRPKTHPMRAEQGRLLLYSLAGTKATKVAEAATGRNTQGVTFTPDGKYLYVQNYVEQELQVFRVTGAGLEDTGTRIKVKGHPASIRVAP